MKKVFTLGSINVDYIVSADKLPQQGETVAANHFDLLPGGKGANQAIACSKNGAETIFIGAVGDDYFGRKSIENLEKYRINTDYIEAIEGESTGLANVLITNKDNRILVVPGANARITYNSIDKALHIARAEDIFLAQFEVDQDILTYAFKEAKKKGLTTILNPAPAKAIDNSLYNFIDYLVINESECKFLSGIFPDSFKNILLIQDYFKQHGLDNIILTMGDKGSYLISGDVIKIGSFDVNVIDTTGAGDSFIGCFASCLTREISLVYSLVYASACGALTCRSLGAQGSIPSFDEVKIFSNCYK